MRLNGTDINCNRNVSYAHKVNWGNYFQLSEGDARGGRGFRAPNHSHPKDPPTEDTARRDQIDQSPGGAQPGGFDLAARFQDFMEDFDLPAQRVRSPEVFFKLTERKRYSPFGFALNTQLSTVSSEIEQIDHRWIQEIADGQGKPRFAPRLADRVVERFLRRIGKDAFAIYAAACRKGSR